MESAFFILFLVLFGNERYDYVLMDSSCHMCAQGMNEFALRTIVALRPE